MAYGLSFNGTSGSVDCGSDTSIDSLFASGGTIVARIRPNSDGESSVGRIVDKRHASGTGYTLFLREEAGGSSKVQFTHDWTTQPGAWKTTAVAIPNGVWSEVAVTYDDSATTNNPTLFVDASSVAITEDNTPAGTVELGNAQNLYIGNRSGDDRTFDGMIDWVRLYDKELSAAELADLPSVSGNLVEAWELEAGSGSTAVASVTTPTNDGTISGAAWTGIGVYQRKSTTKTSSGTTFAFSPDANFASGSFAVLACSLNNSEAGGVAFTTFTVTDDDGNTWTRQNGGSVNYDPGGANAGLDAGQFVCEQDTATITSSTVITITVSTACTQWAVELYEVVPTDGYELSVSDTGKGTGSNTTSPTVTTASLASGSFLLAFTGIEYGISMAFQPIAVTDDSDTTSGSWAAGSLTYTNGIQAGGMSVYTQYKVTTGTGAQTFNPVYGTVADTNLGYVEIAESVSSSFQAAWAVNANQIINPGTL